MSYITDREFYLEVKKGNIKGHSIVQKFGRNKAVPSGAIEPIVMGGKWPTPTEAKQLRVRSTSADDTALSITGAREIEIWGLNENYEEVSEVITLNGLTPVLTVKTFIRIYRAYITKSGAYASQIQSSHLGDIIVEDSAGVGIWLSIDIAVGTFGVGQSQVGCYSVPRGKEAFLLTKHITVNAAKPATIYFFQRDSIDNVVAPFAPMRLLEQHDGIISPISVNTKSPLARFNELTDVGFMGVGEGQATSVSVDFEMLVVDKSELK